MILVVFLVVIGLLILVTSLLTDSYNDVLNIIGVFCGVCAAIAVAIFIAIGSYAICRNIGVIGEVASMTERYESLKYQAENNLYDNDNDIGKKELVSEIQNWNEELAKGKTLCKNFWVGIFYPKILYQDFEPIPINTIK